MKKLIFIAVAAAFAFSTIQVFACTHASGERGSKTAATATSTPKPKTGNPTGDAS